MTVIDPRKVRFLCRRGLLELDVILRPFFDQHYPEMTDQQKGYFVELLDAADPDLYNWLLGYQQPETEELRSIVQYIRRAMNYI